jgi:enoyl-CoA hydratase/carnithine racemase
MSQITVNIADGIATITMGENATFNPEVREAFAQAVAQVKVDETVKALILTGTGKNFNQGFNLEFLTTADPAESVAHVHQSMLPLGELMTLGVPTVAAVNGHAFGLGAMLVLACDYAVMREDRGYFCLPEIDLGMTLVPSMNALVTGRLSQKAVRDCLFAGGRIGAQQAVDLKIIDEACALEELLEKAAALATPIIGKDKTTLSGLKQDAYQPILDVIKAAV